MSIELNLSGHFLIAMPEMHDPVFAATVTYLLLHDEDGALGVIVNRPLTTELADIFDAIEITEFDSKLGHSPIYHGGPVAPEQGFILHRQQERHWQSALENDTMRLTTSKDILQDIANNHGPEEFLFCLGYSGWSAGQLEEELKANAWLTVKADEKIIFAADSNKYKLALAQLGIDQGMLSLRGGMA